MTHPSQASAPPWEEGTAFSGSVADPHLRGVFLAQGAYASVPSPRLVVHLPNMPLHGAVGAVFGVLGWMLIGGGDPLLIVLMIGMGVLLGCILAAPILRQETPQISHEERRQAALQDVLQKLDRDVLERAALDHVLLPILREGRFPSQGTPWSLEALWIPLLFPNPGDSPHPIAEMELALYQIVPLPDSAGKHDLLPHRIRMVFPLHDLAPGLSLEAWERLAHHGGAFRLRQYTFAPAASAHARLGLLALLQERHQALRARAKRRPPPLNAPSSPAKG